MKNPEKSCTVFVMSSNYPRFSGDICGWFIHEISRCMVQKEFRVVSLSPHAQNSKVREVMDDVEINRFVYFFPERFEKLAYGSGILFNLKRYPVAFFNIVPFLLSELFWAMKIICRNQINIIHTHWLIPQGLMGAIIHRLTGIPHIATIHGSDLNLIKNCIFLKTLCRFIVRNSDTITVNSSYMKLQLLGISPSCKQKIQVIPMGIDPAKYTTDSYIDMKQRHGVGHLILSVGRLIDWKGTEFLIKAMPAVLERFPDAKLLIIGIGPERDVLMRQTRNLGLSDRIEFPGMVPAKDLPSYYRSADVFVLPSIIRAGKTEGLGVVLLEAMASGCPVIGSNVGGIPDIITDGENGFLVPEQDTRILADRIVRILSDGDLREKFRMNSYDRIEESFTWDKIAEQFSGRYKQVIRKKSIPTEISS